MASGALVKVLAGGITLPTVPLRGSTETDMLHVPPRLTCLDRLLLSTPAALYAHRKGTTLFLRGTVVSVGALLSARVERNMKNVALNVPAEATINCSYLRELATLCWQHLSWEKY